MSSNYGFGFVNSFRAGLAYMQGLSHDGNRDLYKVFGYSRHLTSKNFFDMYLRNGVANRAVRAFPQATWQEDPIITDVEGNSEDDSPFAEEVMKFFRKHNVCHYFERTDRLSGIGQYSILIMGFDDGGEMHTELPKGKHNLTFLRPYSDVDAVIHTWETDETNPRYNMPKSYQIYPNNDNQVSSGRGSKRQSDVSFIVHHSRVLHVAEFLESDDVYGTPRLMPVFNNLKDLEKVSGGSAEVYWLNGRGGLGLWADKEAALSEDERKAIKTQAEEYAHELNRTMTGVGMKAQPITFNVPDPKPSAEVCLDLISGGLGIPKRILTGSERGELSSTQDKTNFESRVKERRANFVVPTIIRPFIDKMIETGNISQNKDDLQIFWNNEAELTEIEKAELANKKTDSLTKYANSPNAELIVPEGEFRSEFLGLPPESTFEQNIPEDIDESEIEDDEGNVNQNVVSIPDSNTLRGMLKV